MSLDLSEEQVLTGVDNALLTGLKIGTNPQL
jgi:hypothetical protein